MKRFLTSNNPFRTSITAKEAKSRLVILERAFVPASPKRFIILVEK